VENDNKPNGPQRRFSEFFSDDTDSMSVAGKIFKLSMVINKLLGIFAIFELFELFSGGYRITDL